MTSCLQLQVQLSLAAGAKDQASNAARRALATSKTVRSTDRVTDAYLVAGAYRLVGDAEQGLGHPDAAHSAWLAALSSLPRGVVEQPDEMGERATILERLGRKSEVEAVQSQLRKMGYRQTN